jgi:hypothetical protein
MIAPNDLRARAGLVGIALFAAVLTTPACTSRHARDLTATLAEYLSAANRHDRAALASLIAPDAVWYLAGDTLSGRDNVLQPHAFDEGVHTQLEAHDVTVRGDTVDLELVERNDVLAGLGIGELHQFPRFVFRDGMVARIEARRPPTEAQAFADSLRSFATWLRERDPDAYDRLWPEARRFAYGRETADLVVTLVRAWRRRP